MTDMKLENRLHELEGQIDALKALTLSMSGLLQSVEPRDLQRALLSGFRLAAEAEMPLPTEIRETAFRDALLEFSNSLEESLELGQT
ncbi:hypothetical protein [Sulfitobacter sp.]|uniref:hypothetical protein n=1 Tax=Sulfitobacter sp. TaxID=1903071 RepID=UPI0030025840